ncbi:MAG: hypothetical protein E6772_07345 [Dysgonomonas sp.]|nr:hypothetical protein [Dysgonomonas sp.]
MFNFFRKKKKNENEGKAQAAPQAQPSSVTSRPNGALEKAYTTLLEKHRNDLSALEINAEAYTTKDDYTVKDEWLDALAICDVALEKKQVTDTTKELYRQLYSSNWNKYVSMEYDDTDYDFWFRKNIEINNRFIEAGVMRGYCEQSDLYGTARRGYQDMNKKMEYLRKGVEVDDPTSLGDYAYGIYLGIPEFGKANKEEARRLIKRSEELGYDMAPILSLYMDFYDDFNAPDLLEKIEKYIQEMPKRRKPYHLLADYYLRRDELDKAIEAMKKGIEAGGHYSEYLLGLNYLNGRVENADKNEAIRLLENAYYHYVVYAANFLGQYYSFANDENTSIEKAIEWHEKAALYCYAESSFELASIYLYNENYKDIPKGLQYLEQSIEDGSHRGLSEKAYLILETDILPDDPLKAKILLEKAMEMGNEYAPYRLGLAYQNAEFGGEPDYQKALELFELGAEREHLYSIELAGNYYRVGVGGEDETAQRKAVEYLSRACERNSNYARVELAFCYEAGWGVEKDLQRAFDLFKEAADNNYPYANTKMALYFEDGILGEENVAEAYNQYCIAAEAGMPDAIYHKGRYNKYAVGMPENPAEAIKLFNQAAEAGSPAGLVELALAYETEYGGTEFDAQKAMEYMMKAAEMNYPYAQYKVGSYYYYGLIETDINKAFEWYNRAYQQGYPFAALMLGDIYLYNLLGTDEPEYEKAFEYYKYAESQGVVSEGLGVCYDYGLGVEENETEAFKYYTLGANEGYTAAKYRLGLAYKYGRGTTVNLVEAYRWLSDAAQDGNFNAQNETAMMLLNGEGVGKDEAQAIKMLTKIAEEDHDQAQFELGNCYLSGRGVPEDEVQAMYWYQKAADNGNEQAQKITGRRERRKR